MLTVHDLRKLGYKVVVHHNRLLDVHPMLQSRGGSTDVWIYTPLGVEITSGHAKCSMQDNYNRKLGTRIALGRALASWSASPIFLEETYENIIENIYERKQT